MAQIPNNTKLIALVYILEPGKFGHGIINGGGRQLIWASRRHKIQMTVANNIGTLILLNFLRIYFLLTQIPTSPSRRYARV